MYIVLKLDSVRMQLWLAYTQSTFSNTYYNMNRVVVLSKYLAVVIW